MGGYTQHNAKAPGFQTRNNGFHLVQPVLPAVVKTDSPHGYQRLPIVVQIRGIEFAVLQCMLCGYFVDIIQYHLFVTGTHTAEVIHHTDSPVIGIGGSHGRGEYGIKVVFPATTLDLAYEPLHKYAVNAILFHPPKMGTDRGFVVGTEYRCGRAVGQLKGGRVALFVFRHIGPHIDRTGAGLKTIFPRVMMPVPAGTVIRGVESPMMTCHYQTLVRVVLFTSGLGSHTY